MIKIGIHNTGYFSSCAIFKDNTLVFASPEERISRIKFDNQFPFNAIEKGLKYIGATYDDVDEFIIAWNPFINAASRYRAGFSRWTAHPMQRLYSNVNAILPKLESQEIDVCEQCVKYKDKEVKFTFVNHHFAHIGMSFHTSGFKESAIFIADGYGENASTLLAMYGKNGLEILKEHKFPHSLGMFYATMTEFLGFNPEQDEWKVMGAGAYGNAEIYYHKLKNLLHVKEGELELDLNYFNFYNFDSRGYYSQKMVALLEGVCDFERDPQKVYDLAAATQRVFEEAASSLLQWLHQQCPSIENLCFAGGTAMNGLFNGKIKHLTPYKHVHISFAPDDVGNAIGVVLYRQSISLKALSPYWGLVFCDEVIEALLQKYQISYQHVTSKVLPEFVAHYLAQGKIVAWFQGKMEFGQRALGNRSILADPRDVMMKEKLNRAIKYREAYRPFAPAILDEFGDAYFEDYEYVPFMEKILVFKEDVRHKVPTVVHEDNTGRVQSVSNKDNPRFYELIEAFYKLTDIPILVNTSFNLAGEPIVCTPEDAIRTFFTSGLDYLVLGDFIISKDSNDLR